MVATGGGRKAEISFFFPPSSGKAIRRANLLFGLSVLHSSSRFSPKLLNLHSTVKLNITNFVDVISQLNNLMLLLLACSISTELRHIVKSLLVMDSAEVNLCFTGFCSTETGCTVKNKLPGCNFDGPLRAWEHPSFPLPPPPPATFRYTLNKHSSRETGRKAYLCRA